MYTLHDQTDDLASYDIECKNIIKELVKGLVPLIEEEIIHAGEDLATRANHNKHFYLIQEGNLSLKIDKKILCFLNENDLIGLVPDLWCGKEMVSSEFAVKVAVYDRLHFDNLRAKDKSKSELFEKYLLSQLKLQAVIMSALLKSEVILEPELQHFSEGDIIIEQGSKAGNVYTLVEGKAEAFVDGVKVGDILREEIFGMLAAVTGSPRTASVIAASRCVVVAVPPAKFIELIQNKPQAVLKTIENMSRLIVDLNTKVVGFSSGLQQL